MLARLGEQMHAAHDRKCETCSSSLTTSTEIRRVLICGLDDKTRKYFPLSFTVDGTQLTLVQAVVHHQNPGGGSHYTTVIKVAGLERPWFDVNDEVRPLPTP